MMQFLPRTTCPPGSQWSTALSYTLKHDRKNKSAPHKNRSALRFSYTAGRLQLRKSENISVDTGRQIGLIGFVAVCIFFELDALTVVCDLECGCSFHIVELGENRFGFSGLNRSTGCSRGSGIGLRCISGSCIYADTSHRCSHISSKIEWRKSSGCLVWRSKCESDCMIGRSSLCTAFNIIENNLRAVIESKSIIFPVLYELGVFGVIVLAAVTAGQYPPPAKISEAAAVFRKLRREISILIIATSNKYLRNGTRDS